MSKILKKIENSGILTKQEILVLTALTDTNTLKVYDKLYIDKSSLSDNANARLLHITPIMFRTRKSRLKKIITNRNNDNYE